MIFAILLVVILLVFIYLLYVPVILNIDTVSNEYYVQIKGLAKASWEKHEVEIARIKLRVFYFNFYFYPLKNLRFKKVKPIKRLPRKKHKLGFREYYRLASTFKLKKLRVDLDTGDFTLNAKLYPVFALLNYRYGGMHINYNGRNQLALQIENRPIYIIKKLLTFKN